MVSNHVSEGDQCFMCGEDNLHVLVSHHIVPSAYGGSDEQFNRVVLCANHHQAIHGIYSEAVFKRLGVQKERLSKESRGDIDLSEFCDLTTMEKFEHLQRHIGHQDLREELESLYGRYVSDQEPESFKDTIGLETGRQRNRRNGQEIILETIDELVEEHDSKPGAPYEAVFEQAVERGVSRAKAEEITQALRDGGHIMSVDQDHVIRIV